MIDDPADRAFTCECHWLNWGKLIDASNRQGGILPSAEHDVTGLSEDFPQSLLAEFRSAVRLRPKRAGSRCRRRVRNPRSRTARRGIAACPCAESLPAFVAVGS